MGSRIMHLLIANKIADHFSLDNQTDFLLGGIAPDAVSTKETSHFFRGDVQNYTRHIDYQEFLLKYEEDVHSQYILGYYTHLIADDLWLKGFYLPWLRNRLEANKDVFQQYHNDFRLLNGQLLEYYKIKEELRKKLYFSNTILSLQEVNSVDVEQFIPYVLGDMDYETDVVKEPLNVFRLEQIVGYIETAADLSIQKIEPLISLNRK